MARVSATRESGAVNSTDLLNQFRLDVVDGEAPYLWSDPEVYTYLDDAQKMFARLTGGIQDATNTDVTEIDFAIGDVWVALHPSILKIRTLYRLSNGAPVEVVNFEDLQERRIRFDGNPGVLKYFVIGMEDFKARLHPVPNVADSLQLMVDRLPLTDITDDGQTLEIAAQHHLNLLMWMKHKAYEKQDAETMDKTKSVGFEQQFRIYCAAAKVEKDRAKHKTRVVAYGGI